MFTKRRSDSSHRRQTSSSDDNKLFFFSLVFWECGKRRSFHSQQIPLRVGSERDSKRTFVYLCHAIEVMVSRRKNNKQKWVHMSESMSKWERECVCIWGVCEESVCVGELKRQWEASVGDENRKTKQFRKSIPISVVHQSKQWEEQIKLNWGFCVPKRDEF